MSPAHKLSCAWIFSHFYFRNPQKLLASIFYSLIHSLYSSLTIYLFPNRSLKVRNPNEFPRKTLYAVAIILKCVRYIHGVNYVFNKIFDWRWEILQWISIHLFAQLYYNHIWYLTKSMHVEIRSTVRAIRIPRFIFSFCSQLKHLSILSIFIISWTWTYNQTLVSTCVHAK